MLLNGARLGSMLDWLARCLCLLKGDSFALHAAGDLGLLGPVKVARLRMATGVCTPATAACLLAVELSFAPVMVKTNCLQLVNAVAVGEGEDSSEIGRLVVDIFFGQLHFFHVSKELCRRSTVPITSAFSGHFHLNNLTHDRRFAFFSLFWAFLSLHSSQRRRRFNAWQVKFWESQGAFRAQEDIT
ncbi:hypothetical protein ACLB2K_026613 [Fragaria x ananassa]